MPGSLIKFQICVCLQHDLTWEMRLQMLHDVAQGMSYLHSNGQIHGELCSNSLLVAAGGKVDWDWGDCFWARLHTMFNSLYIHSGATGPWG
jgi:hypothetical protein